MSERRPERWPGRLACALLALASAGCASPEDGRPPGGGPGADGGNYLGKPIRAPSKLDGTKPAPHLAVTPKGPQSRSGLDRRAGITA
jgi:hypothetical protein